MSATAETNVEIPTDLVERAMTLSPAAMRKFAGMLWDAAEGPPDDPELVRKETHDLIADRIEGMLSGRYKLVDAGESIRRVREQFLKDHPQ